jgi:outer membrane biosynthesis protein TonB
MMGISRSEPGLLISGIAHAALLVAGIVSFSGAKPFDDAQEAVPVEVISADQLRAITQGEKTAKEVAPDPKPRVDQVAETEEAKPDRGEAKRDVPPPPARDPEPKPEPPKEVAAVPPPPAPRPPVEARPEPKPEPPKPQAAQPPPPQTEEAADIPVPPRRPDFPKEEAKPEPPKPEPPKPQKVAEAKPAPKPIENKPEPKKPDQIARLIDKPADKPASNARERGEKSFDPNDIRKLLQSRDKPQATGSTGREVQRQASLGTQAGRAQKLSLSDRDALVGIIRDQLAGCWFLPAAAENARTAVPRVRLQLNPDGTLATQPVVLNASGDPVFRAIADSAVRAARKCAPFQIPGRFAPYYDDWKSWVVEFDPREMLG